MLDPDPTYRVRQPIMREVNLTQVCALLDQCGEGQGTTIPNLIEVQEEGVEGDRETAAQGLETLD